MGRKSYTNYAVYKEERITSARASKLVEDGVEVKGCTCIECNSPMKFVRGSKRDSYFAHIVPKGTSLICKKAGGEGHLHELSKRMLSDDSWFNSVKHNGYIHITDDIKIYKNDIISVRVEEIVKYKDSYIKPDIALETTKGLIYIEVVNTHPLSQKTKNVYRQMRNSGVDFKLIEIYINDIDDLASSCQCYQIIEDTLVGRLFNASEYKSVVNLDVRNSVKAPFGTCYFCGKPYEIVANKEDGRTGGGVIKSNKVKKVSLIEYSKFKEGDRTSIGSALLHCPHCSETEGIYLPIYCPDCFKRGRGYVPMKFLSNAKNKKLFIACSNYNTADFCNTSGEDSTCDCTLTIYNGVNDDLADEIKCLSSFNDWLRGSNRESSFVKDLRERKGVIC